MAGNDREGREWRACPDDYLAPTVHTTETGFTDDEDSEPDPAEEKSFVSAGGSDTSSSSYHQPVSTGVTTSVTGAASLTSNLSTTTVSSHQATAPISSTGQRQCTQCTL